MSTDYAMPRVGDVIGGKYRLEKVAGEGGMGIVYAAEHLVLKQRVAVKVLLPDAATSEAVVERFSREAQAGARIQSEHVARVMDAGSLPGGAPFLVMEYLEGCDLEELVELQGALLPTEVADMLLQALEALAHAHAVGIVHRDIKPANLFLACRPDGGNVVKLLDFGISKSKATAKEKRLTGQHVLGSPVYMPPEQLRNAKEIDGRADIWSLGVVAYEVLTGKTPFDGDGVGEIFAAVLETEAVPVHEHNPKVPEELSAIIQKCLRRNVEERWPNAAALARAVEPFGSGAWSKAVERAEQVLVRSRMLSVSAMPLETRRVVDAIEAAALAVAARATDERSVPPPSSRGRRQELKKTADGVVTRITAMAPTSRWLGAAAAAAVVIGIVMIVSAVRSTPRATASPGPLAEVGVREAEVRLVGAAQASAPQTPTAAASGDPATVLELPDDGGAKPTAAAKKGGKPGKPGSRPKFLNKRE